MSANHLHISLSKDIQYISPPYKLYSYNHQSPTILHLQTQVVRIESMATASATIAPTVIQAAAIVGPNKASQRRTRVKFISGLNSFGGLKAHNNVAALGLPICTEQCFAKIVGSLKKGRRGGALTSTCNAAEEIFRIATIMNGLVLVGVAVGFVLLRIEAFVEEE